MTFEPEQIFDRLFCYCKERGFAGYDPFDGLNSRIFQLMPFKHSRGARLAFLQTIKRSPVDLRQILLVPEGVNPKALALFALAELSRHRTTGADEHGEEARTLIDGLLDLIIRREFDGAATIAFGYNFDWQSRVFYAPRGTPAIVPTAFAARALIEAYEQFRDQRYLDAAKGLCSFILHGLNRPVETDDEICFSYTPVDHSVIYNASLLAGECLASMGAATANSEYLDLAAKTARFVTRRQRGDGAWVYGENSSQGWADNFHTAYVLLSLKRIADSVPGLYDEIKASIDLGVKYWLDNFFLDDGTPKYYDNEIYPIDIHSAAAAIAVLVQLKELDARMLPLARKVARWTGSKMLDDDGYFYYQKRKGSMIKTPYMRWGQAWMAYALARLMEAEHVEQTVN